MPNLEIMLMKFPEAIPELWMRDGVNYNPETGETVSILKK